MDKQDTEKLIIKYTDGHCTPEEKALVEKYFLEYLTGNETLPTETDIELASAEMYGAIQNRLTAHHPAAQVKRLWLRIAAAASILLMLSAGGYFYIKRHSPHPQTAAIVPVNAIKPGSNIATITLANGRQMVISGTKTGLLVKQGNTLISIRGVGEVVYNNQAQNPDPALQHNTMTTPRGGQYALTLADGTRVWLDALSSITFPVVFPGKERKVKITGQVYFEVAHDAGKPFRVTSGEATIEVLGTHFNICAYPDEPRMKTSLFEGSVKITAGNNEVMLRPGQQGQMSHRQITVVTDADMEEAIAWHRGLFRFHHTDLKTVLRQLSRWYDVDIAYEERVNDRRFTGEIYRSSALQLTDILKSQHINFRSEGKKITIIP